MKRLYLIDGMSLVFRAYHAMQRSGLKNKNGDPTYAVFGFTNLITSFIEKFDPKHVAVVFDRSEPTFRHEMFEEYKANRDEFPEELIPQLKKIKELLDLINIPRIEKAGLEADDIIGTLSKEASKEKWEVFCVTSDKDFYQLVDDNIKILKPGLKGEDFSIIDYDGVKDKFGVMPDGVIDVQALWGDSVDNIPGVKGIGEKTAIPLIQEFGSIENLYENLDKIEKKSVRTKLENNKENAILSKKLVTIKIDAELYECIDDCEFGDPKYDDLDKFFAEQNFSTLRRKWRERAAIAGIGEKLSEVKDHETIEDVKKDYQFIDTKTKLNDLVKKIEKAEILSFDLETDSLDRDNCRIIGFAFAIKEGEAFYIPTDGLTGDDEGTSKNKTLFDDDSDKIKVWQSMLPFNDVLDKLKLVLQNKDIKKIGQNIKFDTYILNRFGVEVSPLYFDSMVASYVIDPDQKHNMDELSKKWLNYAPVPISSLIGEKKSKQISMREVDPKTISDYACEDADIALKLMKKLNDEIIEDDKLKKLAYEIEFPMIEVLTRMEAAGVAIDKDALNELSEKITGEAEDLTKKIYYEAGIEFNIDSPKQLGHILFEKLNIPPVKKTKTGYSTDVQVLTQLAETHPIASYILDYRSLVKLKSTYIDALPKLINPKSGRIHTTYNQTVASTGRLSSTDPNLQNIPIRTELGKEVRRAFIPQDNDNIILSADYSQIELRIMAYICGDEKMIKGFEEGVDIHAATASVLFDKKLDEVDQDDRRIAKTVNFGIMYGLGSYGLSQRIGIGRKEAKEIIDNYFEKYPGIKKYMDMTIESCREKGYAETLCGRRRYFKDINSGNHNLRTAAERGAINMPIQGTASDMMKIAMIKIDEDMRKAGLKSRMMLQVHDELVFEVHPNELDDLKDIVVQDMQDALHLGDVPVEVDTGTGSNWFEAH
jgi:DNA polymerase-1